MLVDATVLLLAVDRTADGHAAAATWLTGALNGRRRVGLAWQTLSAFLRTATDPRYFTDPLRGEEAWTHVARWLEADPTWVPPASERTAAIYGELAGAVDITADDVPGAMLAALAIEHGLTVITASDAFARFPGVRWEHPTVGRTR